MMSDLISRRDAMMEARPEYLNPNQKGHEEYNKAWNDAVKAYWNGLKELPSKNDETDNKASTMKIGDIYIIPDKLKNPKPPGYQLGIFIGGGHYSSRDYNYGFLMKPRFSKDTNLTIRLLEKSELQCIKSIGHTHLVSDILSLLEVE